MATKRKRPVGLVVSEMFKKRFPGKEPSLTAHFEQASAEHKKSGSKLSLKTWVNQEVQKEAMRALQPDPIAQPIPGREVSEAKKRSRRRARRGGRASNILSGGMLSQGSSILNTRLG